MRMLFPGGVHPEENKHMTEHKSVEPAQIPEILYVPMSQHIGAPASPLVAIGDTVKIGQKIGDAKAPVSAAVHSPVSGVVEAIETRENVAGNPVLMAVIRNDFREEMDPSVAPFPKPLSEATSEEIIGLIKDKGIVGMGGATFPTHFKISSGLGKVDTVIVNGAECEPYLTADHRLMLEDGHKVIKGIRIILKAFGLKKAYIGIENNKPDCIVLLKKLCAGDDSVEVLSLKTKYPQGGEKQLISAITGRVVPMGKLPAEVGCAVFNVGTCAQICDAFYLGMPTIERIVTVSGDAVAAPKNLRARIGTPIKDLFEDCGGLIASPRKIVSGGPMMGMTVYDPGVPMQKGTSGILAFLKDPTEGHRQTGCLRCGRCANACPMGLAPVLINQEVEAKLFENCEKHGIFNCIECGVCSYICPSRLHLTQTMRVGKFMVNELKRRAKQ